MGLRNAALLSILVIAILLLVQVSVVAEAGQDDKGPKLEMRVHLLYEKSPAKPDTTGKPDKPGKPGSDEGTYETYGKGIVWKDTPINIILHEDISDSFAEAIWAGATVWDDNTGTDLFGGYTTSGDASWDGTTRDGTNEMVFGDYYQEGVIAVTVVWGYFGGPPGLREILEFDILFDTDFEWGDATVDASVMDVQNIACHEFGHGLGLADLYDSGDWKETMYGYATEGEILKRDLYLGDIAGIQSLYGE